MMQSRTHGACAWDFVGFRLEREKVGFFAQDLQELPGFGASEASGRGTEDSKSVDKASEA